MKILYYLMLTASLVALLANWRRLDRRLYLFLPLLLLALCTEIPWELLGKDNWVSRFLYSVYTPAEYLILCLIIASYLHRRKFRNIIYCSIPLVAAVPVYVRGWLKKGDPFFESVEILTAAPLLCLWTLLYFFQFAADRKELSFKDNPMFWISIGNLLFYSATSFSYGFGGYMKQMGFTGYSRELVDAIAKVFNILLYSLYLIGFLCRRTVPAK